MEYGSAIKWDGLLIYVTTWMDLKGVILGEKWPLSKVYKMHDYIALLQ